MQAYLLCHIITFHGTLRGLEGLLAPVDPLLRKLKDVAAMVYKSPSAAFIFF